MTRPASRPACRPVRAAAALLAVAALTAAAAAPARAGTGGWRWPLDPRPGVLAGFVAPAGPYAAGHRGADLRATVGQPVRAAGPGVVAFAGAVAGRGVVSVAHADGRRTTYEPVAATAHTGSAVAAGEPIGVVSAAPGHCLPVTCLHWGLLVDGAYVDPLTLLGSAPVRLLPVWALPLRAPPASSMPQTGAGGPAAADRGPLMAGSEQ